MKPVTRERMWAPIIKEPTGLEWINWECLRPTRREAKHAIVRYWGLLPDADLLKSIRFARVTITEETRPSKP